MADDCLFCRIARKEIPAKLVFENEKTFIAIPLLPGGRLPVWRLLFWYLALPEQRDILADVAGNGLETKLRTRAAKRLRIARGELHELEAGRAERIVFDVGDGAEGSGRTGQIAGHGFLLD